MSLLVIGTVAFDSIETPFGSAQKILGGAATYISLAASYFTDKINLVSVVGNDFPDKYIDLLKNHKINTEGIKKITEGKTFYWAGKYFNDMNVRETLTTELNVLADFDPVIPEKYKDCEYLMLGNLTPAIQMKVLNQLTKKPKLTVLDTMNYWMNTAWDDLTEVLKLIDVLTINDEEARLLSKEYSLVKAAKKILKMGPKYLIIKKGENGALLFNEDKIFFAPALPLAEVYDPTGAGDTFAGGFIGHLAKTKDISFENMKRAVIYGSALASFTCEKFGTERIAGLQSNEVAVRVEKFIDLVHFDINEL
ncbi:MAG: bifunctional hydroxymethylpyrimidine kinase/phosphomethylpyrimidine kinase [Bacteroidales bacterium]|nr:bifunctional hydroxymethylpyrimidine kinase/phosphomethylpyrimidine kinase [Bacteroidales bacterium]